MSESLRLRNGDLALNGRSFDVVSGGEKVMQDLRCALLTQLGSYENQPEFGSSLDSFIGLANGRDTATLVQAEIQRICAAYQRQQISRNQADGVRFGRMTVTPSETLLAVDKMETVEIEDRLIIVITLKTGSGQVTLNVPVALH